ncbi:sugar phosphate nucleotidyltransferase [Pigmentibacter sp. JX0631]|uniref:sugar phosphate nucleotidyltransferase n=1 Tax=Pigmentibacter sp. JX0631 TaxID=2976982 RepID=UPI0024689812|nr:sugar phosphate nucleotidyltransferase [Pigmentibacter sp. JX0631]WGL60856.1 sugar phosphate nucleotidyltransferase [Pigmentibacter sp. JX0631]
MNEDSPLVLKSIAEKIPVVIFAGGLGTRLSEETMNLPKPMVPVGGTPIIVHIMDFYAKFGFCQFVICGGYKIDQIKNYFLTLPYVEKNIEINFSENMHEVIVKPNKEPFHFNRNKWKVTILETGLNSMTGHRVRQAVDYLNENTSYEHICLTYGDGLTNANLHEELKLHLNHTALGTVLAVHNPGRFGVFEFDDSNNKILRFAEKPKEYINGGYFILRKGFEKFLPENNPDSIFEKEPLQNMAELGELVMYKHDGFWQCMDTKRDKDYLENLWSSGEIPWMK